MSAVTIPSSRLPLITVIVPLIGRSTLVARALTSAIRQTYPNLEILAVAAAPPDDGQREVLDLTKNDGRLKVVVSPLAQDVCGAWEAGRRHAKGTWVCFLRPEGRLSPDGIERRFSCAMVLGTDYVHGRTVVVDGDGTGKPIETVDSVGPVYPAYLRSRSTPTIDSTLASADLWTRAGGIDLNLSGGQDWDAAIRLAERSAVAYVPAPCNAIDRGTLGQIEAVTPQTISGYEQVVEKHRGAMLDEIGTAAVAEHYRTFERAYADLNLPSEAARCRTKADGIETTPRGPALQCFPLGEPNAKSLWIDRTRIDPAALNMPRLAGRPLSFAARAAALFRETPMPLDAAWHLAAAVDANSPKTWSDWILERGKAVVHATEPAQTADAWALDRETIGCMKALFDDVRPALVLEFGSGRSTLLMARMLADLWPDGALPQVVSVEQSLPFLERTRADLAAAGVADRIELIHARMVPQRHDGVYSICYDLPKDRLAAIFGERRVDFVLIDGPSSLIGHRHGTLPAIRDFVAPGAPILLDDGLREPELAAAMLWERNGIARIDGVLWRGKGFVVGRMAPAPETSPWPAFSGEARDYLAEIFNIEKVAS